MNNITFEEIKLFVIKFIKSYHLITKLKMALHIIKIKIMNEGELIFISKHGIKSKKIDFVFLLWNTLLFVWCIFASIQYFSLRTELVIKENVITDLQVNKQNILSNIVLIEKNISNVEDFIRSFSQYDRLNGVVKTEYYSESSNFDTSNVDAVLNRSTERIKNINLVFVEKIKNLKKFKEKIEYPDGIDTISHEDENDTDSKYKNNEEIFESIVLRKNLNKNIQELKELEKFINETPLVAPINFNYISSGFGIRVDPIFFTKKRHNGIDLVGPYMSKIKASADGKVSFSGMQNDYGNVIILQHKNEIKTLYGHLDSINVKVGQIVKKGDIIGTQGSTGKSTGQHLHYEIFGKNGKKYDPAVFLDIGTYLY